MCENASLPMRWRPAHEGPFGGHSPPVSDIDNSNPNTVSSLLATTNSSNPSTQEFPISNSAPYAFASLQHYHLPTFSLGSTTFSPSSPSNAPSPIGLSGINNFNVPYQEFGNDLYICPSDLEALTQAPPDNFATDSFKRCNDLNDLSAGDHFTSITDDKDGLHTSQVAGLSSPIFVCEPAHATSRSKPSVIPRYRATRTAVLENWLLSNSGNPYPTKEQLSTLAELTKRSIRQTRNALSNLRARMQPKNFSSAVQDSVTVAPLAVPLPNRRYEGSSDLCPSVIFTREKSTSYGLGSCLSPYSYVDDEGRVLYEQDHGLRANDTILTSVKEFPNPSLEDSQGVLASFQPIVTPKRKGKRQHASRFDLDYGATNDSTPNTTSSESALDSTKLYHCTVCTKSFKNAWGWRRHEYGTHDFNPVEWTCMLDETIMVGMDCIFCSQPVEDHDLFEQHNIFPCIQRGCVSRTFALEDRLKQHVQQIHLPRANDAQRKAFKVPEIWARSVALEKTHPDSLWCGFCRVSLQSISLRMDHVAQHFRDGLKIDDWVRRPTMQS